MARCVKSSLPSYLELESACKKTSAQCGDDLNCSREAFDELDTTVTERLCPGTNIT